MSNVYSEPDFLAIIYLLLTFVIPRFSGFRFMFMSLAIAAILPMIEAYGVLLTNTVSAILAWGGFGYVEIHPPLLSWRSCRNLTFYVSVGYCGSRYVMAIVCGLWWMLGSPRRIITREAIIWQPRHLDGKGVPLTYYSHLLRKNVPTHTRRYYEYSRIRITMGLF